MCRADSARRREGDACGDARARGELTYPSARGRIRRAARARAAAEPSGGRSATRAPNSDLGEQVSPWRNKPARLPAARGARDTGSNPGKSPRVRARRRRSRWRDTRRSPPCRNHRPRNARRHPSRIVRRAGCRRAGRPLPRCNAACPTATARGRGRRARVGGSGALRGKISERRPKSRRAAWRFLPKRARAVFYSCAGCQGGTR
jgi:hypothetical protein